MDIQLDEVIEKIRPVKGIIFDCDGVLLNSRAANISFYNRLRQMASMPPLTQEDEDYVHMATYHQALEYIMQGVDHAALAGYLDNLEDNDEYYSLLQIETGLVPMLDWLSGEKFRLGICTNRLSPLDVFLSRFNLHKYFNPMQTASNSMPKPSPDGLLKALETWNLQPAEVAYVGDSLVDELAADAARVPFWSFKNQKLKADLHIPSFGILENWLKNGLELDKNIKKC